jgi:hypothetical protein
MSTPTQNGPCFLCGAPAKWRATDHSNRQYYHCSSANCGAYEISVAAMRSIDSSAEFKRNACEAASQVSDPELVLEIRMSDGPAKQVVANVVRRRVELGGKI